MAANGLWSVFVGSAPGPLAVSSDGTIAFVGLTDSKSVRLVNLFSRAACQTWPLLAPGAPAAGSLHALLDETYSVVVLQPDNSWGRLSVYDNGVVRPKTYQGNLAGVTVTGEGQGLALGPYHSPSLYELTFGPAGVSAVSHEDLLEGQVRGLTYGGGHLYTDTGYVIDASGPTVVGATEGNGAVAVDVGRGEVFYAHGTSTWSDTTKLAAYDIDTFLWVRDVPVPSGAGRATRLLRWGAGGMAVLGTKGLVLINDVGP